MNAVVGKVDTKQASILAGDHHIVTAGALAPGLKKLKAGMVLKETASGSGIYTSAAIADAASCCAVLLEDVEDTDVVDVESVAVHGAVRKGKLTLSDGTTATASVIAGLRNFGVYAV